MLTDPQAVGLLALVTVPLGVAACVLLCRVHSELRRLSSPCASQEEALARLERRLRLNTQVTVLILRNLRDAGLAHAEPPDTRPQRPRD